MSGFPRVELILRGIWGVASTTRSKPQNNFTSKEKKGHAEGIQFLAHFLFPWDPLGILKQLLSSYRDWIHFKLFKLATLHKYNSRKWKQIFSLREASRSCVWEVHGLKSLNFLLSYLLYQLRRCSYFSLGTEAEQDYLVSQCVCVKTSHVKKLGKGALSTQIFLQSFRLFLPPFISWKWPQLF